MGGVTKASLHFFRWCRICFQRKTRYKVSMKYQKIHACPNDGLLYRNEFEEMHNCPRCGVSRYKVKNDDEYNSDESTKKGPSAKVLWYLSIIPRFKCLFDNANDTKDLTWHADWRNCDGPQHYIHSNSCMLESH